MAETRARGNAVNVLVAGGGVAALEVALALRSLAPRLVDVQLLAPEHHFWYRPLGVLEPFQPGATRSFELAELAAEAGASHEHGELTSVDAGAHVVRTRSGAELPYDILVLACGAIPRHVLPGALTFRGAADGERFESFLDEFEDGTGNDAVFAVPGGASWPLPLYELALLTRARLDSRGMRGPRLTLVTHEHSPLAVFGDRASDAVACALDDAQVGLVTSVHPAEVMDGTLRLVPDAELEADRVVTLARLEGPRVAGLPHDAKGFVPTDLHGRVNGIADVYAAGDVTAFPVKQGGVAAQQALAAAEHIASRCGVAIEPEPFDPVLRAVLITGREPLYLRRGIRGGAGDNSDAAHDPLWWPSAKIFGRYLAPFLASRGADAASARLGRTNERRA